MTTSSPPQAACPIGIFDSGVGGTTVLREIRQRLPDEPLLYLADQARCPYGPRPVEELRRFTLENSEWLLARGAKMIVVACNTASAAALRWIRQQCPTVPFVGMVPALKPAALSSQRGVVGVLATPATMQGMLLQEVREQWASQIKIIEQVGEGLVRQIESGALEDEATRQLLWRYLSPMVAAGADAVVLGCTHYPYLAPLIREIAPSLRIVDAAPAVALQVERILAQWDLRHPTGDRSLLYTTTGPLLPFRALLQQLNLPLGQITRAEGHPASAAEVKSQAAGRSYR